MGLLNKENIRSDGEKKLQVFVNIGSTNNQRSGDKEKNKKSVPQKIRKLATKLCNRNLDQRINTCVVHLVWYSGPFLKYELRKRDQKI